ncbi:MAG: uracil-DNA glycosylase [Anaerolineae bacterium]|nr:uracil-DNA glycosylase [Anaerolineae bacterium]
MDSLPALEAELVQCRLCPRLVAWREEVARTKRRAYRDWDYWGKPVPGFGDPAARLLVLGLAPGAHGSNRTGRMFTGDASGDTLYPALHRAGFCSQPHSARRDDGLQLYDVFITAVGRCAPPDNKPTRTELDLCEPYLRQELALLPNLQGIVALGRIAFEAVRRIYGLPNLAFAHNAFHRFDDPALPWLLASYHPSRQNTQTGRLTEPMFDAVWKKARDEMC